MELVHLLQCAGFQFHKFEYNARSVTNEPMKLELTCGKSGITATMTYASTIPCSCPPQDKLATLTVRIYTRHPAIFLVNFLLQNAKIGFDPAKHGFAADIFKALASIFAQTDTNRNELIVTAHGAWEVDPNMTPPRDTSSPMADICKRTNLKLQNSLKQVRSPRTKKIMLHIYSWMAVSI